MSAAARQRRHRARERAGRLWLGIETDEEIVSVLVASGRIDPDQADDVEAIASAAGDVLDDWIERWLRHA